MSLPAWPAQRGTDAVGLIFGGLLRVVDHEYLNWSFCGRQFEARFILDSTNYGLEHAFIRWRSSSTLCCLHDLRHIQVEIEIPRESGFINRRLVGTQTREEPG
jgi:hypothetical protein